MGGAEFLSLVEVLRAFGWAAIGIHFVYLYAIPGIVIMAACHLAAFLVSGRLRRILRTIALAASCLIGVSFAVLCAIHPTQRSIGMVLCAAYVFLRTLFLYRKDRQDV